MAKTIWKPGTMIYPLPAVLVSCGNELDGYNLITVSWTGTICTDPPMCYISLRPERHSFNIIKRDLEYVINLTTRKLAFATDWCGVRSGADYDKFRETGLTPSKASVVKAPLVEESPLSIECRVKEIIELGSHSMFISEVVAVDADESFIDPGKGVFRLDKACPLCYSHGKYYDLGKYIGRFGYSVKSPSAKKDKEERAGDRNK